MESNDVMQKIAALEDQIRVLLVAKRDIEEKIAEISPRQKYVAIAGEWFWREVEG
jgi:hypothetical protein